MAVLISEKLVTSNSPKIYGKADYEWSGTTLKVTASMRTGSSGGWANDPWCAWITVDGDTRTVQTKGRTSGTIGTTWRSGSTSFTVSGSSKTVSVKFSTFNKGTGGATHTGTATSPVSAPTYNSVSASNITSTSVRLTASINLNGGSLIEEGWDLSSDGGATWTYYSGGGTDKTITGLTRNKTYHYRGWAKNAGGGTNSAWNSFTTLAETPTISAVSISNITSSSANASFSVTDNGGKSITDNYIDCFTDSGCTNKKATITGTSGTFSGLSRYTTYYARANASNGSYRGYSAVKSFTTNPANPTVSAITVGTLTPTTAPLSFSVTDNGGKAITSSKIEVSESNFGTVIKTITSTSGTVSDLTPHKTYYARGYTTNGITSKYTAVKSFTTTFTNPGQPGAITLTYDTPELVKRTKVTIKWTASSAGSTAVAGYRFQVFKNGTQVASTDTESTAVTKTITLSDYSFTVNDKLMIRVYAYSKCAAGDKHLSSARDSSTVTIISDRYVWVSVNGAAYVRRKLYISNNGAAYVWVKREKIKVSSNGGTMTFPIK